MSTVASQSNVSQKVGCAGLWALKKPSTWRKDYLWQA